MILEHFTITATVLCLKHIKYTLSTETFACLSEAATRGVLLKKVLLKISQYSQENICGRVSFLIKLKA